MDSGPKQAGSWKPGTSFQPSGKEIMSSPRRPYQQPLLPQNSHGVPSSSMKTVGSMNENPVASGLPMASVYGPSGRSATATASASPRVAASVRHTYQYHFPFRSTACEAQARSPWKAHGNVAVDTGAPR